MFSDQQNKDLAAPLSRSHVHARTQGGRQVSYIEGWRVIEEANRIFGFDCWSRETVELKCVSERERDIGQQKVAGWGVTYIARVRVTVYSQGSSPGAVIREGCGTGHGIDRDLGQAHESALKEAETDAMKRALMTFGNQFGLALYDKEQTNVTDDEPEQQVATEPATTPEPQASKDADSLIANINGCVNAAELDVYAGKTTFKAVFARLPANHKARVSSAGKARREKIGGRKMVTEIA